MSAQPVDEPRLHEVSGNDRLDAPEEPNVIAGTVEVRRSAIVTGLIGVAASAIAIAYLWRAAGTGALVDWGVCVALGGLAAVFLRGLLDSRTPLLVADELGVRVRLGSSWRGLPWEAVDEVLVQPRRGWVRDGRVVVSLDHVQWAIEGLEGRARRQAAANQKSYGGALAVPLGLTTRVPRGADHLGERLVALARGRAAVVTLTPKPEPTQPDGAAAAPPSAAAEPGWPEDARPETVSPENTDAVTTNAEGTDAGTTDAEGADAEATGIGAAGPEIDSKGPAAGPFRLLPFSRRRGELRSAEPVTVAEPATPRQGRETPRGASAVSALASSTSRVRAIAKLGEPVAPLVIDDFQTKPAHDPVIGPELAAARTRVGLTVDELADRTRIRPHVIESIEVDDFDPCGGDFYARGHIRTLARVLGKDPEPLLTVFDSRYAHAPINARRVFEAELATGTTGSMRSTVGGPNWTLLIGVVLSLVLVWSLVRIFAGAGQETLQNPPPLLNGSAGIGDGYDQPREPNGPKPLPVQLTAVNGGAHVRIRDGDRRLVFDGDLAIGEVQRFEATPPVTVGTDNGGAVTVTVAGRDMGFLGELDQPGSRSFARSNP